MTIVRFRKHSSALQIVIRIWSCIYWFYRFVIAPIGAYLGIRDNLHHKNLPQVNVLENEYGKCKNPTADTLTVSHLVTSQET